MSIAAILSGVLGFIKAVPIIDSWFQMLISLYMTTQTNDTLAKIADAAALAARSKTDEERYAAAQAWQSALSRTRIQA